jgi:hypothetical protein
VPRTITSASTSPATARITAAASETNGRQSPSSGSGVARLGLGRALGLIGEEAVTVDDGGREIDQLAVIVA